MDLRGQQLKDAYQNLITKGSGGTPIRDGEDNPFFYDQGTWTPVLSGNAANMGDYALANTQFNRYTVVGNQVNLSCWIQIGAINTAGSGALRIHGMPYPKAASSSFSGVVRALNFGIGANVKYIVATPESNGSESDIINIRGITIDGTAYIYQVQTTAVDTYLMFNIQYIKP